MGSSGFQHEGSPWKSLLKTHLAIICHSIALACTGPLPKVRLAFAVSLPLGSHGSPLKVLLAFAAGLWLDSCRSSPKDHLAFVSAPGFMTTAWRLLAVVSKPLGWRLRSPTVPSSRVRFDIGEPDPQILTLAFKSEGSLSTSLSGLSCVRLAPRSLLKWLFSLVFY